VHPNFPCGFCKHKKQKVCLFRQVASLYFGSFNSKYESQFGKGQFFLLGLFNISYSNLYFLYFFINSLLLFNKCMINSSLNFSWHS